VSRRVAVVTGAMGFLGSHMVEHLLARDYAVRAIDRPDAVRRESLDAVRTDARLTLDLRDLLTIAPNDPVFADAMCIIHCAGIAALDRDPEAYFEANVRSLLVALEAARRHRGCRVVHPSSAAIYARATTPIAEDHPLATTSPYSFSKLMAERLAEHWREVYRLPIVSFRIFNGYGPRCEGVGSVGMFLESIAAGRPITVFGDGNQLRDFIHVDDIAEAFVLGAETNVDRAVYNLGTGTPRSVGELARLMHASLESGPARPNEQRILCADTTAIRQDLGWSPRISLEDGIAALIANRA
jgi:UDP-glucose 4-epimerase